jgi:8-oxo-dGTP pyrophosphatase MutT (NUDIX family)
MRQAAVALIEKDGLFLSVSRKNDPSIRGFAGGSVEEYETIAQAIVRELYEETGIIAREYEFFFKDYDGHDFETTCFIVTKYDGNGFSREVGVVEWVKRELLEEGPFAWFNKKVFEKYFNEQEYTEEFKLCKGHCCSKCGTCKFNLKWCPVANGEIIGDYLCENCDLNNINFNFNLKNDFTLSNSNIELLKEHIEAKTHSDPNFIIYNALKTLPIEKEEFCNYCGLTCKLNDEDSDGNYGLINAKVQGHYASTPGNGAGALDDLQVYKFSLCEFCCDYLFTQFKKPVLTYDFHDRVLEKFESASDRVANCENGRDMKEKFFTEKYKRDVARGK